MKNIIYILLTTALLFSCRKETARTMAIAGYYDIANVKTKQYVDGELQSENEANDIGTLLLRQDKSILSSQVVIDITTPITLKAWDEILFVSGDLDWDSSQSDEVLAIFLSPDNPIFLSTSLVFTITKNKRKTKELLWTEAYIDQNTGEYKVLHETYTLEVK